MSFEHASSATAMPPLQSDWDAFVVEHPASLPSQRPGAPEATEASVPAGIPGWLLAGVCFIFFCSGAASLICEVVWFKQLQFVLGSSTFAISVVVASFFSGLGLGSWYCGRLADRWRKQLLGYAGLELALAALSAMVTLLLSASAVWVEWLAPWLAVESPFRTPVMLLLSLVILLPPTSLMGATLPVLVKYFVRRKGQLAQRVGLLYGLNTLGASAGCFVVGFALIGRLGIIQSGLIASAIYLLVATAAAIAAALSPPSSTAVDEPTPAAPAASAAVTSGAAAGILVGVFAMMGFASIAYEVVWFRILTNFSIQSVYAFSGMLSVYLLGLVLGSLICSRFLAPRKDRLLYYFARVQLLIAIAAALSLGLLGRSANIMSAVSSLERQLGVETILFDAFSGVFKFLVLTCVVLLAPATLIGIAFPLASELTIQRIGSLGNRLGLLYGLNTFGGVLGSLLTGFVLLPLLGSQASFTLVIAVSLLLFALTALSQSALRNRKELLREGAITAAILTIALAWLGGGYLMEAQTAFNGAEVLAFRESKDATFLVLGYESKITQPYQQIIVNGKSFANNSPPGRRYMSVLGHLPVLLHPNPKNAVVIAIGTGTTAGALTLHPSLERVWAVDIAQDVFDFAQYFVPLNHDFMNCPKVRPVVADGRHFLLCTSERFDVLTFEPPPPNDAGVVNLYSQDFYRLARNRMAEDGLVCQWIPLDLPRGELSRMLIKSMMEEFPHVSLWISNRCEGIAVGSTKPLEINIAELRRRMLEPRLSEDLRAYGLAEPEQLLATFLAADEGLARFVGDLPAVTDNRPRVEYFGQYVRRQLKYDDILPYRQPVAQWLDEPPADRGSLDRAAEVMTHIWHAHELKSDGRREAARQRLRAACSLDPANQYLAYLLLAVDEN